MRSSPVSVGCRASPLSRAQFVEFQSMVDFEITPVHVDTHGCRDRILSLRDMEKTDFFTREIDNMQLEGGCRLSLHSAKDLPDPLPNGLTIAALTKGVDPSDSLVLRPGESLRPGMRIGTSSHRREAAASLLCEALTFADIRGNIDERLALVDSGELDGVIIAEAALIRLGLTHLHRLTLPGNTTPMQGQLAVLCLADDHEMLTRLVPLDSRSLHRTLYLGLDPKPGTYHYPIIETKPFPHAIPSDLSPFTHVIYTSKTAVRYFPKHNLPALCVGKSTAQACREKGIEVEFIAKEETAEGLIQEISLEGGHILWPHSALSRRVIPDGLSDSGLQLTECILYTTITHRPFPPPDLSLFDELYFTSPSTVRAFRTLFGAIPAGIKVTAIGPVTERYWSDFEIWLDSRRFCSSAKYGDRRQPRGVGKIEHAAEE